MAKTPNSSDLVAQADAPPVEARVLQACCYGAAGAVATIPASELAAAQADGLVDGHPDAVAYARSLSAGSEA